MQHCPSCKVDFADEFESCFQCGAALEAGSIEAASQAATSAEEEQQEEEEKQAAARMLSLAKSMALALGVGVLLVVAFVVLTDDTVQLDKTWTLVHSDEKGQLLLEGPGIVASQAEHALVKEKFGLTFPPIVQGKTMLVYYPVTSEVVFRKYTPKIIGAHRDDQGVVVHVGPSEDETPAIARLFEGIGHDMMKGLVRRKKFVMPKYQLVAVARLPFQAEEVRYAVPKSLGGSEAEVNLQELSHSFVREMTLGVFGSFFEYAIIGSLGLLLFIWILIKFS